MCDPAQPTTKASIGWLLGLPPQAAGHVAKRLKVRTAPCDPSLERRVVHLPLSPLFRVDTTRLARRARAATLRYEPCSEQRSRNGWHHWPGLPARPQREPRRHVVRVCWQAANLVSWSSSTCWGRSVDGAVLPKDEEDRTRHEPERLEARAGFSAGPKGVKVSTRGRHLGRSTSPARSRNGATASSADRRTVALPPNCDQMSL
jgi:hypothetical protein